MKTSQKFTLSLAPYKVNIESNNNRKNYADISKNKMKITEML